MSPKIKKIIIVISLVAISVLLTLYTTGKRAEEDIKEVSYNEFIEMIEGGDIEEVSIDFYDSKLSFKSGEGEYKTDNPKSEGFKEFLLKNDVKVEELSGKNKWINIALELLRYGLIIGLMVYVVTKMGGAALTQKPKEIADMPNVTFDDVAGNEEVKEEMKFLVDFLKNPSRYSKMGAKFPKGIILDGPPGTGKTLIARTVAGEAGVPFYSANGADFVEMYVGLGARRVRNLFVEAKKNAPCIIFIDEIDALGSTRGGDAANSEKDQTINALLGELSGFNPTDGVLVLAATNRAENLDPALIRPGRFDRHISVMLPEHKDRVSILELHSKNKKLDESIDIEALAHMTIGFSGAGLETLMNEAAIIAVNNKRDSITISDIDDAFYKTVMKGSQKKKNPNRDAKEIKLVAYHEAGHALAAKLLTDNHVPKVTITPFASGAGGATFNIPKKMGLLTKEELLNNIRILYAGRAAEYLLFGDYKDVTTGASADIKAATSQIMRYFNNYGMDKRFGLINVSKIKEDSTLQASIDLSNELYESVLHLLKDNLGILKDIASALIDKESLSEDELDEIIRR